MGAKVSIPHSVLHSARKRSSRTISKRASSTEHEQTLTDHSGDSRVSSTTVDLSLLCFNAHQKTASDRMTCNHFALKALFEGNVMPVIKQHIDFNSTSTIVLDIGCGSGSWVMDMATEYPSAQFIGIDQLPLFPHDIRPANVTFKQADVLTGLPFEDNTFDFVQMRLFLLAFNRQQWLDALKEVHRVLKPGGFIQLAEPQLMDPGDDLIVDYTHKIKTVMEFNGFDAEVCDKLSMLLEKTQFIPVENIRKAVPLNGHMLSNEFLYIADISVESCKPFLMEIHNMHSDDEFMELKRSYLESRKNTSESAFTYAVGQKPH
ncbi:hypothetical protein RMATCC62417_03974 [Rhizopus microsporus]|nr:hypothetical protein RMATCC62417_03974 [Rhizopus microsporus]